MYFYINCLRRQKLKFRCEKKLSLCCSQEYKPVPSVFSLPQYHSILPHNVLFHCLLPFLFLFLPILLFFALLEEMAEMIQYPCQQFIPTSPNPPASRSQRQWMPPQPQLQPVASLLASLLLAFVFFQPQSLASSSV